VRVLSVFWGLLVIGVNSNFSGSEEIHITVINFRMEEIK